MQVEIQNLSAGRALILRVRHESNPFASDGDSPWRDETGAPADTGARNVRIEPRESSLLDVSGTVSISIEAGDGLPALLKPLARVFGRADEGPETSSSRIEVAIVNRDASRRLGLRQFSSAAFPFKALHESVLAPEREIRRDVGEGGFHLRIAVEGTAEFEKMSSR